MYRILAVFTLLFISSILLSQTVIIKGTLLGADGNPLPAAHVHMVSNLPGVQQDISRTEVTPRGTFLLKFDSPALVRLKFTGVNHYPLEVPFLCQNTDTINVSIKLKAYDVIDPVENVYVIGDFNNFEMSDDGQPMTPQQDGMFAGTVNAVADDTLGFQIMGLEKSGLPYASTISEKYVYDGNNAYRSVIRTQGGATQVSFDPSAILRVDAEAAVKFQNEKSIAARFYAINNNIIARQNRFQKAYNEFTATGKPANEFKYDWSKDIAAAKKGRQTETDSTMKHLWLLAGIEFNGMSKDTLLAGTALSTIPATSPLWSYNRDLLALCYESVKNKQKYSSNIVKIINENGDMQLKPLWITQLLDMANVAQDKQTMFALYQKLYDDFDNTEWLKKAQLILERNASVKTGDTLPHFSLTTLDDSSVVDNKRIAGEYWIIQFWATWNNSSVKELDNLTQVYDKYKDKGLNILGISLDKSVSIVNSFRKNKVAMPWVNSIAEKGILSDIAQQFEVMALPKTILIGKAGKIIAVGSDLKGKKLVETVENTLGK